MAGVLKLYFRGLENPLFPKERFTDLISCISKCLHYFLNKNMCVWMSVCSPASVRELTHGVIVRLLTCGCKSIIDSHCEFAVLWTMIECSWIKRSQSFASDSGTVTFFSVGQGIRRLGLTAIAAHALHYSAVCVSRRHDASQLQTVVNATLFDFRRVQKVRIVTITVRVRSTEWVQYENMKLTLLYWICGMV